MSPDIRDEQVVRFQDLTKVPQDPPRIQQILGVCPEFRLQSLQDRVMGRPQSRRWPRLADPLGQGLQRFADLSEDFDRREVVRGNLRREGVDMDDSSVAPGIPRARIVFDEIVSDADDQVAVIQSRELVISR